MSYLGCDKCGGYYELQPSESPEDFSDECECGGTLKHIKNLDDGLEESESGADQKNDDDKLSKLSKQTKLFNGLIGFWDKQSNNAKIGIGICGLCCIGLFLFFVFGFMFSSESMTAEEIKQNAQSLDDATIYNDDSTLIGKPVKFTFVATDGLSGEGDILGNVMISNGEMVRSVVVEGNTQGVTIYPSDIVVVYGIYKGVTYRIGASEHENELPLVTKAIFVPTGEKYQWMR